MDETYNLKLPYILPSQAQKHVTHNEALRILDAVVQLVVLDRHLTAPPSGAEEGDRYIIAAGATGSWLGQDGRIAAFADGSWTFIEGQSGWRAWVLDENDLVFWDGSAWQDISATISSLQNLLLLGVGTEADAANPVAAKINNALLTARYSGEGGDGDLRIKANKEGVANTVSYVLQTGYSGRAEFGLAGGDDFSIKVSPDGAAWTEALRVGKEDGSVRLQAPATIETSTGIALHIDLLGGNGVFQATRYADGASAPVFFGRKARGTRNAPAAVKSGDTLIGFRGYGYTGSRFLSAAEGAAFLLEAAEDFVDGSAYGTQIRFFTTANGATSNMERLRITGDGDLQMGGANTVINASRHPVLRSYAVAALPQASPAGQLIHVSDGNAGRQLAVSDGAQWRFPDGDVVT
jgi:hypothetical protein